MSSSNTETYTLVTIQKLVPIWDLLPDEYNDDTHINLLKKAYNEYCSLFKSVESEESFSKEKSLTYTKEITEAEKEYQSYYDSIINKQEWYQKNPTHTFKISDYLGFSLKDFANYNYSLKMIISMDIKEHYDGYQQIYLFSGSNLLNKFENEHGGNGKYTKYATGYFTYDVGNLNDASVEQILDNDEFTIMTGARGAGKNDWYYKNIKVEFQFSL